VPSAVRHTKLTGPACLLRVRCSSPAAEALYRLPEDYREVIVLPNLEGLSHEEVAARMGRAVGAVRMRWLRALPRLRRDLVRGSDSV
jgi:RNA polymerase sigma-70 factor (ECF subfamily)